MFSVRIVDSLDELAELEAESTSCGGDEPYKLMWGASSVANSCLCIRLVRPV